VLVDASTHAFELVMGSRGRGALGSLLLGSVSAAVARHAACPVVVCRPVGPGPRRAGAVVGADGTRESLPVVEFAYRQAYLRKMPLTVLHTFFDAAAAVARYREARGEPSAMPDLEQLRETLAQSVAGLDQDYPGVAVTLSVEHGMADQALTPRGDGWDLVVVGRHPMTTVDRLLTTSISIAVLERAHGTVAIVPEASDPDPV
jgi:nucleotide-binding universal stress UspA family protein